VNPVRVIRSDEESYVWEMTKKDLLEFYGKLAIKYNCADFAEDDDYFKGDYHMIGQMTPEHIKDRIERAFQIAVLKSITNEEDDIFYH